MKSRESSWGLLDASLWMHPEFRAGARHMAAVTPGVVAWGLVTGVAMVKGGLPLPVAVLMSLSVFAASAQLAALPLMLAGAPLWVVWATALCVNLRFVIFSAQMRLHMMSLPLRWRLFAGYVTADITYVLMVQRHGRSPAAEPGNPGPLAYFVGLFSVNWLAWNVASLLGVLFAGEIPMRWGLGFAGTLALAGLLVSLVQNRAMALSAGIAGTAAVAAFGLPFKLNMIVAVASAVACGLVMDEVNAARQKPAAVATQGVGDEHG